ncbi:hypothetical protein P4S64_13530 [Vibrio sp. M60_M31a]
MLVLPPNWKTEPENTQFIRLAHRYRSEVDLVVTTPRDLTLVSLMELLDKPLIDQLVDAIAQPLDSSIINRMKPIMTLGMESIPSIADGITLDVDLSRPQNLAKPTTIYYLRSHAHLNLLCLRKKVPVITNVEDVVASSRTVIFLTSSYLPTKFSIQSLAASINLIILTHSLEVTNLLIVHDLRSKGTATPPHLKLRSRINSNTRNPSLVEQPKRSARGRKTV